MKTSEREALQQQIDALQAKLDSLPNEPAFEPVIGWKPEIGEYFYYAGLSGSIWKDKDCNLDDLDGHHKHQQLCKTEEQAEHLAAVSAARLRVLRRIEELNEGWVADYGNQYDTKYYIYYNHEYEVLEVNSCLVTQESEIAECCRTEEIAEQVIEECGEDWKLWKGIKSA